MYFNLGKIKILKYLHDASIFIDPFEEEIFIANKRVTKKISVRLQTILQSKSMKPLKASREALNRECCQSCYQKFVKLRAKSLLAITLCCRRFELRILKNMIKKFCMGCRAFRYWKSWIVSSVLIRWVMYNIFYTLLICIYIPMYSHVW